MRPTTWMLRLACGWRSLQRACRGRRACRRWGRASRSTAVPPAAGSSGVTRGPCEEGLENKVLPRHALSRPAVSAQLRAAGSRWQQPMGRCSSGGTMGACTRPPRRSTVLSPCGAWRSASWGWLREWRPGWRPASASPAPPMTCRLVLGLVATLAARCGLPEQALLAGLEAARSLAQAACRRRLSCVQGHAGLRTQVCFAWHPVTWRLCLLLSGRLDTPAAHHDTCTHPGMSAVMQQAACKPVRAGAAPSLARRQQSAVPQCSAAGKPMGSADVGRSGRPGGLYLHAHPVLPLLPPQAPSNPRSRLQRAPAGVS